MKFFCSNNNTFVKSKISILKKIVFTGGPSSGKTTLINSLLDNGFYCFPEISRNVIEKARLQGVEQLFLHDPYLFSQKLLEGRIQQYYEAKAFKTNVFFDRGIPDVEAYLHFKKMDVPQIYQQASSNYQYDMVFMLPSWKEIYQNDEQRYESFTEAQLIEEHLRDTYLSYGYHVIDVPKYSVQERLDFVLKMIQD